DAALTPTAARRSRAAVAQPIRDPVRLRARAGTSAPPGSSTRAGALSERTPTAVTTASTTPVTSQPMPGEGHGTARAPPTPATTAPMTTARVTGWAGSGQSSKTLGGV